MSAIGPKRTLVLALRMSASDPKGFISAAGYVFGLHNRDLKDFRKNGKGGANKPQAEFFGYR